MRHKYSSNFAFNDFLFNILLLFVFLFVLAVLMMNPPTKKADIPTKAEFMVVLEWDVTSAADIDLWIQRDEEEPIGYRNKESTVLHLERDDLGHSTDTVIINGIRTIVPLNREVITIRGIVPGEYYVGIHYYKEPPPDVSPTIRGTVTLMDVNPYIEVWSHSFEISNPGTKVNMPAVTIDSSGTVTAIYDHSKNLGPDAIAGTVPDETYYSYN